MTPHDVFTPEFEQTLRIEYWTTVLVGLLLGILLFLAIRFYWSGQLRRLNEVGVADVFLASESLRWGSDVQAWARAEGLSSFEFPGSVLVGIDRHGLGFWKSANSSILRIPLSNVSSVVADGDSVLVTLTTRNAGERHVVRFRPRRQSLLGFLTMNPAQVSAVADRIRAVAQNRE